MGRLASFDRLYALSFPDKNTAPGRLSLMADVLWERLFHGTEIQDYFQYEFYKLKGRERRRYMTFSKLRYTMKAANDPAKRAVFDNKALFNRTFADYVNREWLDAEDAGDGDAADFLKKHPSYFAKAKAGMFGKNAGKRTWKPENGDEALKKEIAWLRENGCIAEELIAQHPALARFNPDSVNTLRVVTLRPKDGEPRVMAAVLRIGRKGKTADNFHHYGIASTVDVETGTVNSPGIDREFKRYLYHPDSGEEIIGFRVPSWDKVTALVKKAALVVPEVRYVGWDVAIDDRGEVQLIEGNYGADPDVTQMPCREGKWSAFEPLVEELARGKA